MHIIDSYLQRIVAANTSTSMQFAQYLNANPQFVNAIRAECDSAASVLMRANIDQQRALNYVADILAGGAYIKYIQSNQYLQAGITPAENNFIHQYAAKVNTLRAELASVTSRLGQQQQQGIGLNWQNNTGGASSATVHNTGGSSLLDIGNDKPAESTVFGAPVAGSGSIFDAAPTVTPMVAPAPAVAPAVNTFQQPITTGKIIYPEHIAVSNLIHVKSKRIQPGEDMKLNYVQHERNLAFYNALTVHGKLVPEDHTRVIGGFLEGFDNNVNTIVTEEPLRLGYIEHNVDISKINPGFTTTEIKQVEDLKTAAFVLENHLAIHLGPDFPDITKYPIKGPVMVSKQWFVKTDIANEVKVLSDCNNLNALGDAMRQLRQVIPTRLWFELEHELTRYVNNYLCSTLPALLNIDSFTEDIADLQKILISEIAFTSAEDEYDLFHRFTCDVLAHLGQMIYIPTSDLQRDMFADDPASATREFSNDIGLLLSESTRYVALTRFTSAELQIACPKIHNAEIQPTGGYVDPNNLPELNSMLALVLSEATNFNLNEAYLITEDGFYLRASRALLMDGYILDAPVAL